MQKLKAMIEKYNPTCEQEEADKNLMLEYIENFKDTLTRENKTCHFTA